jgi:hypothetical protein
MEMSPADRLLADVWNRLTHDWSRVTTFRQMGVLGEDAAREDIHRSNTYFVQQQLLNGEHARILKDRGAFIRDGWAERMPREMTEGSVKNFRRTLHAAALVFSHSILDAAVFDCVRICAISAPREWDTLVGNRKVALADVAATPYSELLQAAIENDMARLERESLLAKVDRVFHICRPTKSEYLTNGFRFDRDRLSCLDDFRHKVVHAPGGTWSFDSIYEDMQFMQNTGLHIFVMVGEKFGLCFSGREAMELLAARYNSGAA